MMKKHEKILIEELSKNNHITANQLADILKVSNRSIKSYVKSINAQYPNAIQSSYKGYSLNKESFDMVLLQKTEYIPQTMKERVSYIINLLISNNEKYSLDIYDLCDELYISLSTLKNDLKRVKGILLKHNLNLHITSTEISLEGNENNRRKLLSSLLQDESSNSFVDLKFLQEAFQDIDVAYIKYCILSVFEKNHYFINDYSLQSLIIHTTIAIDRIKNGYSSLIISNPGLHLDIPEFKIANELSKILEDAYSISYSNEEIYDMALLISSRATEIDYHEVDIANIRKFIGEDCYALVTSLISEINKLYYLDLNENEFFVRFALHIHNLLIRSNFNILSKNPLTKNIKESCPLIFDMSVTVASIINEKEQINLNDDEIGYIAFHLGSTIEMQKIFATRVSAVLFSQNYYDMNLKLSRKINEIFEDRLIITNLVGNENDLVKMDKNDLVITTIPLSYEVYKLFPVVNINVFLTDKDVTNIKKQLDKMEQDKKKKVFENNLRKITSKDIFDINHSFINKDDCIQYMCNKLVKMNYVEKTFKEEIYDRENLSSTAFGAFAIPHAIHMNAKKTGIYTLISKEPIHWDEHKVHIVLLMCFNATERKIFNDIFSMLATALGEPNCLKKLYQCTEYSEFIKIITSYI